MTAEVAVSPVSTIVDTTREFDPMTVVRVVMVVLAEAGVVHEVRSVYRLAEAASRLLEQFDVEPVTADVELATVIPLQRRAVDR